MTLQKVFIIFGFVSLSACASIHSQKSLFNQLGGMPGIESITDQFIDNIGHEQQIFHYFAEAKLSRFRSQFIVHLCAVSGGPCQYQGDSMKDIHTGMNINEADFNRVVELLINAMESNAVATTAQNKLLRRLAPLREEIILL